LDRGGAPGEITTQRLRDMTARFRLADVDAVARRERTDIWLVGGCLRDLLLGRPVREIDLALGGDPFAFGRKLARRLGGAFVPLDAEFGIARIVVAGAIQYDLARFKGSGILQDLSLRDFTVNALGLPVAGAVAGDAAGLLDPTGGRDDLARGTIRACYASAIADDPLRALRAYRIGTQLGFALDPATRAQVHTGADGLDRVAAERITDEMLRLLSVPASAAAVRDLAAAGLLARVVPASQARQASQAPAAPGFELLERLERVFAHPAPASLARSDPLDEYLAEPAGYGATRREVVKLAALLVDCAERPGAAPALSRLCLSGRDMACLAVLVPAARVAPWESWTAPPDDLTIYRFFRDHAPHAAGVVLLGLAATAGTPGHDRVEALASALRCRKLEVVDPPRLLDGHELMAIVRLPPGPRVGELLEEVREAQAGGRVRTREEAIALVERLTAAPRPPEPDPPGGGGSGR
jgi:hypothetical protein